MIDEFLKLADVDAAGISPGEALTLGNDGRVTGSDIATQIELDAAVATIDANMAALAATVDDALAGIDFSPYARLDGAAFTAAVSAPRIDTPELVVGGGGGSYIDAYIDGVLPRLDLWDGSDQASITKRAGGGLDVTGGMLHADTSVEVGPAIGGYSGMYGPDGGMGVDSAAGAYAWLYSDGGVEAVGPLGQGVRLYPAGESGRPVVQWEAFGETPARLAARVGGGLSLAGGPLFIEGAAAEAVIRSPNGTNIDAYAFDSDAFIGIQNPITVPPDYNSFQVGKYGGSIDFAVYADGRLSWPRTLAETRLVPRDAGGIDLTGGPLGIEYDATTPRTVEFAGAPGDIYAGATLGWDQDGYGLLVTGASANGASQLGLVDPTSTTPMYQRARATLAAYDGGANLQLGGALNGGRATLSEAGLELLDSSFVGGTLQPRSAGGVGLVGGPLEVPDLVTTASLIGARDQPYQTYIGYGYNGRPAVIFGPGNTTGLEERVGGGLDLTGGPLGLGVIAPAADSLDIRGATNTDLYVRSGDGLSWVNAYAYNGITGSIELVAPAAADVTDYAMYWGRSGEFNRFRARVDGQLQWGGGAANVDTTLARAAGGGALDLSGSRVVTAANIGTYAPAPDLTPYAKTDGSREFTDHVVAHLEGGGTAFATLGATGFGYTSYPWYMEHTGKQWWGPGNAAQDTTLGRMGGGGLQVTGGKLRADSGFYAQNTIAGTAFPWSAGNGSTVTSFIDDAGRAGFNAGAAPFSGAALSVAASLSAAAPVAVLRGAASQSGNLTEWQNSTGVVKAAVNAAGRGLFGGGTLDNAYGLTVTAPTDGGTDSLKLVTANATQSLQLGWAGITASGGPIILTSPSGVLAKTSGNYPPLVARSSAAATANIQEWQDSASAVKAWVDAAGSVHSAAHVYAAGNAFVAGDGQFTGAVYSGNVVSGGGIGFVNAGIAAQPQGASGVAAVIRGRASQTGNLQEWQDSASGVLASVTAAGQVKGSTLAVRSTGGVAQRFYVDGYGRTFVNPGGVSAIESLDVGMAVVPRDPATQALVVRGLASQTGNIVEVQNSGAAVLTSVNPNGNVTVNTNGSTTSAPRLISLAPMSTAEAARIDFDGSTAYNTIAVSNGNAMLMRSYWSLVLRGGAQAAADSRFPANLNSAGVLVDNQQVATAALVVRGVSGQSADLQRWTDSTNTALNFVKASGAQEINPQTQGIYALTLRSFGTTAPLQWGDNGVSGTQRGYVNSAGGMSIFPSPDGVDPRTTAGYGGAALAVSPRVATEAAVVVQGLTAQSADLMRFTAAGSNAAMAKIDAGGRLTITNSSGTLASFLGGTGNPASFGTGRAAVEATFGVAAATDQFFGQTVAGDAIIRQEDSTKAIHVGAGATRAVMKVMKDQVKFEPFVASAVPVIVKGAALQSGNLQEWQDSGGAAVASVGPTGTVWVTGTGLKLGGTAAAPVVNFRQDGVMFPPTGDTGRFGGDTNRFMSSYMNRLRVGPSGSEGSNVGDPAALIASNGGSAIGAVVRGAASQSANLQEWQSSAGTMLARVESTGRIYTSSYLDVAADINGAINVIAQRGTSTQVALGNQGPGGGSGIAFQSGEIGLGRTGAGVATLQSLGSNPSTLVVKGTTSQSTTNLLEARASTGTLVAAIGSAGAIQSYAELAARQGGTAQVLAGDVIGDGTAGLSFHFSGDTKLVRAAAGVLSNPTAGGGIRLRSPDGLVTRTLSIDNSGTLVVA